MRETDQCFAEDTYVIERAKALAAESGVPLTTILARYGFEAKAPPPAAQDGADPESTQSPPG
jgi:hypothetical protein